MVEINTRKGWAYKCDVCGHYERNLMNFVGVRGGLLCGSCWRGCGHIIEMYRNAGIPKRSEIGLAREMWLKYVCCLETGFYKWDEEVLEVREGEAKVDCQRS